MHIVCLDAPSPPNYGGAIDMYYKVKALAETGRRITLHYFQYRHGRGAGNLEKYCAAIHAYPRKSFLRSKSFQQPFIVQSRINAELIARLNEDDSPVLLEGLHCAGILPGLRSPQQVVLRMHNEEASYYHHLAQAEPNFIKRFYFRRESRLLQRFQHAMNKEVKLACLAETDMSVFQDTYGFKDIHFVPCFLPWQQVQGLTGKGDYCLYHGNLSVSENEEAALWLIQQVFSKLALPLRIAGSGISERVIKAAAAHSHITLINGPSIREIDSLIANAQVNLLPSLNRTGVKLKLLNALFNGRFCLANGAGVAGSKIESGVVVREDPAEWIEEIKRLFTREFTHQQRDDRIYLETLYNNATNAERLNALW